MDENEIEEEIEEERRRIKEKLETLSSSELKKIKNELNDILGIGG
jgi:F0F1-type ATP synthase membrane subunit b/b'